MRQTRFFIDKVVDVEEQSAGDMLGQILGLGIASRNRQMPGPVKNDETRCAQVSREPVRLDDRSVGDVQHSISPLGKALRQPHRGAPNWVAEPFDRASKKW